MYKYFDWKVKEKPEDFIVSEVADYPISEDGKFFLYRLVKRNLNTIDLSKKLGFRYVGLKDKTAITFQYVSFKKFLGNTIFEKIDKETFYGLIYIGKTDKKLNIGHLKGNKFSIKIKKEIKEKDFFINYFDLQRLEKNWERGIELFTSNKPGKTFKWLDHFLVDSFLSFLWNQGVEILLKEYFEGYYVVDKLFDFYIPYTNFSVLYQSFPKFFPILGYKVKLNEKEEEIYKKLLKRYSFTLEKARERLKDIKIKGDYRKTFLKATDVYIKDGRIYFFIPKGAYATMYLKHLI